MYDRVPLLFPWADRRIDLRCTNLDRGCGKLQGRKDEEARLIAEANYAQRHNRAYGFELWQGDRLVHKQSQQR